MLITFNQLKTFYSAIVQRMKGFRGNWNQNDPTADDYIKNRTHWEETGLVTTTVLPETTVDISDDGDYAKLSNSCPLKAGEIYSVVLNGTTYECVARMFSGGTVIGNGTIYGDDELGNGEPFSCDSSSNGTIYLNAETAGTYTISIYNTKMDTIVHKLDKKFIDMPEGIVTEDSLAQVAFTGDYYDLDNTPSIYTDVVRYNTSQSLNDTQKSRARTNINAADADDVYTKDEVDASYIKVDYSPAQLLSSASWRSIAYGNGKFVAVSERFARIAYSDDGINWHESLLTTSRDWYSVTYGDGKFVAIANDSNVAIYSEDGVTWNECTLPSVSFWYDVTYGDGKFVAVASSSSSAAYSEDGMTWHPFELPDSLYWYSIVYGNGKFVAVACYSDVSVYSEDGGITWKTSTMPNSSQWRSVAYGDGKFVAVANSSNTAAYSEDGVTWKPYALTSARYWSAVAYGDGKFIAVAGSSRFAAYSENGVAWYDTELPSSLSWSDIVYGNDKFVAIASGSSAVAYSVDGTMWTDKYNVTTLNGVIITPEQLGFKEVDLTGYATETYVDSAISEISSKNVVHGDAKESLYNIIETYILNINYDALKFDVTEIVSGSISSAALGTAVLGTMILGNSQGG